jgi:tripartite-type tricarboxylate transporter receptor subunit TctC
MLDHESWQSCQIRCCHPEKAMIPRRLFIAALAGGCVLAAPVLPARTAEFPERTVRIIVPVQPGGSVAMVARVVGYKLTGVTGQQVLIEHHSAALGRSAAELVARSPADGYTLLLASNPLVVRPSLFDSMTFDLARDFEPVTLIAAAPFVLVVNPSLPVRSVRDLIAYARVRPGVLNYASGLRGDNLHMAAELFKSASDVDIVRVAYRRSGGALASLLNGETDIGFLAVMVGAPYVKAGRMRALAVTSTARSGAMPNVPTMAESGLPGYEFASWYGLLAAAGTPDHRIAALNGYLRNAAANSDLARRLSAKGADVILSSSEAFGQHLRAEHERWARAVQEAGLK